MGEDDPIRRIDIERLSFSIVEASSSRIPNCKKIMRRMKAMKRSELTVPDAHPSNQPANRIAVEDVADHAICFALVEAPFGTAGDDSTCILAAVLQ
jgi:hypothetical protein